MVDLTIAIGTLDEYDILERCLHSVYEEDSPHLTYQVWIVYNGSGDESVTKRIEGNFPQVRLIKRKGPLGYGATYNLVLGQCKSRYVLALDSDTIVKKGTLSRMVSMMDANPEVGIAGCKTLNPDGSFQRTYALQFTLWNSLINIFQQDAMMPDRIYRDTSSVKDVGWLNGSFMLARSEALAQAGLFDERYYTSLSEADWCYRIHKAGWRVTYVPSAEIIHVGREYCPKTKGNVKQYLDLFRYHVNQYYFFRKYYSPLALFLLRPIMIAGSLVRVAYYGLMYIREPEKRLLAGSRLKVFWGVMKLSCSAKPYDLPHDLQS